MARGAPPTDTVENANPIQVEKNSSMENEITKNIS